MRPVFWQAEAARIPNDLRSGDRSITSLRLEVDAVDLGTGQHQQVGFRTCERSAPCQNRLVKSTQVLRKPSPVEHVHRPILTAL